MVGTEARTVAAEVPKYAANVRGKIRSLREISGNPLARRFEQMGREISDELGSPPTGADGKGADGEGKAAKVVVEPDTPPWLSALPGILGRLAETLTGLVMALVLLVFMLMKREDLRNRFIRLLGHGRLTATTRALEDASQRITRYLLMQLLVNSAVGLTVALGLLAVGLPYGFLWGFLGFLFRYVPYVGLWVASLPPILLSLAMYQGWTQPFLVLGLFVVVELIAGNVVEPRLYGRTIGVSEIAFLVAAAFGAFLWGPIGIVLSSPAIVCLVVLGKHIPSLSFLDVLLGDEPVLSPDVVFYQRLLAHKDDEATEIVAAKIKESSAAQACDEILVPALNYFKRDRERDELTGTDAQFVLQATAEILGRLERSREPPGGAEGEAAAGPDAADKVRLVAFPAHDEADRLAPVCAPLPSGPRQVGSRVARRGNVDVGVDRPHGPAAVGTGMHCRIAARPPGPGLLFLQAAAEPVPGRQARRGAMGTEKEVRGQQGAASAGSAPTSWRPRSRKRAVNSRASGRCWFGNRPTPTRRPPRRGKHRAICPWNASRVRRGSSTAIRHIHSRGANIPFRNLSNSTPSLVANRAEWPGSDQQGCESPNSAIPPFPEEISRQRSLTFSRHTVDWHIMCSLTSVLGRGK